MIKEKWVKKQNELKVNAMLNQRNLNDLRLLFFDLPNEIKRNFFHAVTVLELLYRCTSWALKNRMEKKLNGNYTKNYVLFWINPGSNTPQNSSRTATYLSFPEPSS